jgi:hypothetical protein
MQPQVLRWCSGRQILSCHSEQSEESGVAVWFLANQMQLQVLTLRVQRLTRLPCGVGGYLLSLTLR